MAIAVRSSQGAASGAHTTARAAEATGTAAKTRIQQHNERKILDAADAVFAKFGYSGATIDTIADRARISKPVSRESRRPS